MIRLATRYDIPRLLEIVQAYAFENPIKTLGQETNHFPRFVEELLFGIIAGRGFILIDKHMHGALIAIRQGNIWSPKVQELHELLWWVEPEYRNGTIGGRLWKEFDRIGSEMLARGDIQMIATSTSSTGPFIDYRKRGYKPVSVTFVKE